MPLSKGRDRERKRQERANVQPNYSDVQPNIVDEVKRLYPDGHLPNCPDGRYRQ